MHLLRALGDNPRYVLMRGVGRFIVVRRIVRWSRRRLRPGKAQDLQRPLTRSSDTTMFPDVDVDRFVEQLETEGTALGLRLPPDVVEEISQFAATTPCYADREPGNGFLLPSRGRAESALGKPILVAQYFNTEAGCDAIRRIRDDITIQRIAARYLEARPRLVGVDLWWTFPVDASDEDRRRHAHLFHRDVDDFRFLKFFFYLTDVGDADGPHVVVTGSHLRPLDAKLAGRLSLRRLTDEEVDERFGAETVKTILGVAGDGFAEDTFGVHKGMTPVANARLILQLQFALFDYGITDDRCDQDELAMLV
jgi:hypothetical protein